MDEGIRLVARANRNYLANELWTRSIDTCDAQQSQGVDDLGRENFKRSHQSCGSAGSQRPALQPSDRHRTGAEQHNGYVARASRRSLFQKLMFVFTDYVENNIDRKLQMDTRNDQGRHQTNDGSIAPTRHDSYATPLALARDHAHGLR